MVMEGDGNSLLNCTRVTVNTAPCRLGPSPESPFLLQAFGRLSDRLFKRAKTVCHWLRRLLRATRLANSGVLCSAVEFIVAASLDTVSPSVQRLL
ncbi:hypothetical protein SRHO_G00308900 [Serrasalmus rhombeus]